MTRDDAMEMIAAAYRKLRQDASHLEKVLQTITDSASMGCTTNDTLTEKELKRLDKAVTVMKVGFKIVKKVSGATKR
jgi:prefoldin subunit 5